ncbi:carbon-nitrogen hydrolase family protein [Hydrogenimonas sp.]
MTTSNAKWKTFAIQMATSDNFDENIAHLLELIAALPAHSIVVTPEVCLTGFAYDRMNEAAEAGLYALEQVKKISDNKIITLTTIAKEGDDFVNRTDVLHNREVVHTQHKVKLFPLGNEHHHFKAGSEEEIKIFEIDGIKFGLIVCFELRFTEFWLKLRGADIILNPSLWGKPRKQHYEILTRALAITNQCYVVAADSANPDMARSSAIIDPNGKAISDDYAEVIEGVFDPREVKRIRRYIEMDLFHG